MNKIKIIILSLLISILFSGIKILAQSAEDLYQAGVQQEEIKGDLEKAIDDFSAVLKKNDVSKETAAMAQLHIGLCYEKLGKDKIAEAVSAFNKVIKLYPAQKDAVQIAQEKLAAMNSDGADIQEIKDAITGWDKAYESKDIDRYCSFLSNEFINNSLGSINKMKEFIVNRYFSKWKKISITSKIKSIDKTGYNYVADEEVNFLYTDWNGNEKSEYGVDRYLTFKEEDGQWKILSLRNQQKLPDVYKRLSSNYPGIGSPGLVYICHISQHIVSVIDPRTDSLIGAIPSGNGSCDIAFSSDRGYIANFNSDNITIFNKKNNEQISTVPVGQHPCGVLITSNGKYALITHQSNDGLWIMSIKDNQIVYKIPGIYGMTLSDSLNKKIYASAVFQPFIYVINPYDQTIIKKIEVGGRPLDIAVTPDGKFIYVANSILNEVQKIDTQTDSVVNSLSGIDTCRGIAVSPDGKFAYVTNVTSGTVTVIDLKTDTKIKILYVGRMPTSISVDKENDCAYVSNQGESSISIIDMKKNEVIKTISVADNPIRVKIF
ncbi:MAG: beta-propeller fold lactonase family protein [Ignavibacteriaceae bacterium]